MNHILTHMKRFLKILAYLGLGLVVVVLGYGAANFQADMPVEVLKAKYTNAASRFVRLDGMDVHYRDEGNPNDSVPLVLIHGTSSFLQTWDGWVGQLQGKHRIIRMDLPGFALTGPNPQQDYSMGYYVRFVRRLLDTLGVRHCYVAGNSLGGGIAWHYALAYPEQVKKLILIDAGGYTAKGKRSGGNIGFRIARMPLLNQIVRFVTPRSLVKKSLEQTYGNDAQITEALIDQYWEMTLREGNRQALIKRMQNPWKNESASIRNLNMPSLILWGELDQLIPVEHAQLFGRDIANSQVIVYPGVGHIPMEEIPQQTAQDVSKFLGESK